MLCSSANRYWKSLCVDLLQWYAPLRNREDSSANHPSQTVYRTQDAPRYIIGHGAVLGSIGFGLVCSPLYAYFLTRENAKRDAEQLVQDALPEEERKVYTITQLRVLGDLAPAFRYTI